jgi:hypothetical protein
MVTVDEMLADPLAALDLPDGAIPQHAILIVEYDDPGATERPGARRLAYVADNLMSPWLSLGMLRFACELEYSDVVDERGND